MKSPVVKRSIVIAGHKTSVSLEDAFWTGLKEIAAERHITLSDMVAVIDQDRRHGNLSTARSGASGFPFQGPISLSRTGGSTFRKLRYSPVRRVFFASLPWSPHTATA